MVYMFQLQNGDHLTLDNLRERWHGINESILDTGMRKPGNPETTTSSSFLSPSIKSSLVSILIGQYPRALTKGTKPLPFAYGTIIGQNPMTLS
jgi:hypothetical protein